MGQHSSIAPVARATVVDQVTDALVDAVVAGHFPVGGALPPERDLAEQLGVNRTTLRQAVARLEQIGLLSRRQGSGTRVRDPWQLTDPTVVARLARAEQVAFVADLLEVREALAGLIGRRAQGRITPAHVAQLRELCDAIAGASTARDRQLLELTFFGVLVDVAGNRVLRTQLRWVEDVYARLRAPSVEAAFASGEHVVRRLRQLLEVIEDDGDLARAMTDYARDSGTALLAALSSSAVAR